MTQIHINWKSYLIVFLHSKKKLIIKTNEKILPHFWGRRYVSS